MIYDTQPGMQVEDDKLISFIQRLDFQTVVYDGQYGITEGILYGFYFKLLNLIPQLIPIITKTLDITDYELSQEKLLKISEEILAVSDIQQDLKILKLGELSLQQAVDLSCLLLRVEMDFQKYTEDIPTVGGQVKLAVVDKKGFRYISCDEVLAPTIL